MWILDQMCERWTTTPADLLNGDWLDYQFNLAVFYIAKQIEKLAYEKGKDGKFKRTVMEAIEMVRQGPRVIEVDERMILAAFGEAAELVE